MATERVNDKGFRVVEQPAPYRPTESEPGHDGQRPKFVESQDFVYVDGKREPVLGPQNINCDRIAYLFAKKRIELRQYQAAERIWRDWYDMGQFPKASNVIVGNGASGGSLGPGDVQVQASIRFHNAKRDLEWARNWAIVELVVLDQVSVEKAAGMLHLHSRFAMACLHCALHMLANHYKFA